MLWNATPILVVDDSAADRFLATELLELLGCAVETCSNGQEAVRRATAPNAQYAMVLMDLHMPFVGGVEATQKIRKSQKGRGIPILAVTSDLDWLMSERHTQAGFSGACLKPLDLSQVAHALKAFG